MRIPSQEAFATLEMALTQNEQDVLSGQYSQSYHSEHAAHLVLTALRNNVSLDSIIKVKDTALDVANNMKKLVLTASPETDTAKVESFFWSIPLDYSDEDRIYLASAFLSHGESFSSLLVSFRSANSTNVPDFVPVSWFNKIFK